MTEEMTLDELKAELATVKAALAAANNESAGRRLKLKELEDTEAKRKAEALPEIDRIKAELLKAQGALEKRDLEDAIREAATVLKFRNPRYASLADLSGVKRDEGGKFIGIDEALKKLAEADPDLISKDIKPIPGTPQFDGGKGQAAAAIEAKRAAYTAP